MSRSKSLGAKANGDFRGLEGGIGVRVEMINTSGVSEFKRHLNFMAEC